MASTPEHYYPVLATLGATSEKDSVLEWNDYRELGLLSMTFFYGKQNNISEAIYWYHNVDTNKSSPSR